MCYSGVTTASTVCSPAANRHTPRRRSSILPASLLQSCAVLSARIVDVFQLQPCIARLVRTDEYVTGKWS
eukprot:349682-Chlamydomonas_euryale.AAC.23